MSDERQPDRLSAAEARKVIREIAADGERVVPLRHAEQRMEERDISMSSVRRVVRAGAVTEGPYLDVRGNWRVEMQGRVAGDVLTVALSIEWRTRLLVVTVIKQDADRLRRR